MLITEITSVFYRLDPKSGTRYHKVGDVYDKKKNLKVPHAQVWVDGKKKSGSFYPKKSK